MLGQGMGGMEGSVEEKEISKEDEETMVISSEVCPVQPRLRLSSIFHKLFSITPAPTLLPYRLPPTASTIYLHFLFRTKARHGIERWSGLLTG